MIQGIRITRHLELMRQESHEQSQLSHNMALSPPLLYTYRRCPYAMRARMALLLAQVSFDAWEIVLRNKPEAMVLASPKATVPVLILADGAVLEQSWDIVKWALTQPGASAEAHACWHSALNSDSQQLLLLNDGAFKYHLDRYKYPERFETIEHPDRARQLKETHREQAVVSLLEPLEQRLRERAFLGGARLGAADIGIFPFVRQFAAVDPAWFETLPLDHVKQWLAQCLGSALFAAAMQKLPSNIRTPYPVAGQ